MENTLENPSAQAGEVVEPSWREYLAQGWAVFPVYEIGPDGKCACGSPPGRSCSPGKHPRTARGLRDATTDPRVAAAWWAQWPSANVGVATGKASGLVVVDLDVKPAQGGRPALDGVSELVRLEAEHGALPDTLRSRTGRGGLHLFFAYPDGVERIKSSAGEVAPGVDVRAEGGYVVVPPSNHESGQRYRWLNPDVRQLAELPGWLLERLSARRRRPAAPSTGATASGREFPEGKRNAGLTAVAGRLRRAGLDAAAIEAALLVENATRCKPPLEAGEVAKIAASVSRYDPAPKELVAQAQEAAAVAAAEGATGWWDRLAKNARSGLPLPTSANVAIALEGAEELAGVFRWNTRASAVFVVAPPPWHRGERLPRPWADPDIAELAFRLSEQWCVHVPIPFAKEAVETVAYRVPYDPVVDYLTGLSWDGTPRLETWLQTFCAVQDSPHVRLIGVRWLVSAVARTFAPGCKADHVLLLEGNQGDGKSTVAQILAVRPEWYTDDVADPGTKAAAEQLQGKWIVELAELASMRRKEVDEVKAFVSRTADNYRAPYARIASLRERTCVFLGTTNPGAYLVDPTGARRFWIAKTTGPCDTAALFAMRDQLWAEAVVHYHNGVRWYPDRSESAIHAEAALSAQSEELWDSLLEAYLAGRNVVSLTTTARDALKIAAPDFPRHQRQISDAMRRLGWTKGGKDRKVDGKVPRYWTREGHVPTTDELREVIRTATTTMTTPVRFS
jgi:predicted P-loop ATPase